MFYVEEAGHGSWKVTEVNEARHSSYKFMQGYETRKQATLVMLTDYYEWPRELAEFAVEKNLPLVYHDVKSAFDASVQPAT